MPRRCRPLLGTFVEIDADSEPAIDAAFAAIAGVHWAMSAHEPDSELSRINRHAHREPVEVSAGTAEVLMRALHWRRASGGAFDVVAAGARSLADGRIPRHPGQPDPVAADSGALMVEGRYVRLSSPACLDLGGIAKGFAVDQAVASMRKAGVRRGMVNAGGDLFGFGPDPWTVEVVDPGTRRAVVQVDIRDESLATSASVDGSSAHLPCGTGWASVTVRAPSATDADALTKIAWAGSPNLHRLLAEQGAAAFGIRPGGLVEPIAPEALAA